MKVLIVKSMVVPKKGTSSAPTHPIYVKMKALMVQMSLCAVNTMTFSMTACMHTMMELVYNQIILFCNCETQLKIR